MSEFEAIVHTKLAAAATGIVATICHGSGRAPTDAEAKQIARELREEVEQLTKFWIKNHERTYDEMLQRTAPIVAGIVLRVFGVRNADLN